MTTFLAIAAVLGSPVGVALGWWLNQRSARLTKKREAEREERRRRDDARAARVAKLAGVAADLMPAARRAANTPKHCLEAYEQAMEGLERLLIEFHLEEDEEMSVRATGLMRLATDTGNAIRLRFQDQSNAEASGIPRSAELRRNLDLALAALQAWAFQDHEHDHERRLTA